MTNATLDRAKDIRFEIDELKRALPHLTRSKVFEINSGSCGYHSQADPFLAQVETEIKTYATQKLNDRIDILEKEFNSL